MKTPPLSKGILLIPVKLNASTKIKRGDDPMPTKLSWIPAWIMFNTTTKAAQLMEIKAKIEVTRADVGANHLCLVQGQEMN